MPSWHQQATLTAETFEGYGSASYQRYSEQQNLTAWQERQKREAEKPPLVQRIIERIKQVPENIRARSVGFSGMLDHQDEPHRETYLERQKRLATERGEPEIKVEIGRENGRERDRW